ncbi:hypothetical protein TNCV_186051 [Trichonephila clavipes]|nr:hypothetical protein TNCV_186051 [Trichonephila clavipes]
MTKPATIRYLDHWATVAGSITSQGFGIMTPRLLLPPSGLDYTNNWFRAGSDVVQSGRPIFDDFFQHLWPYIGNNTANVVFQMVKRLWLIRIDQ